MVDKDLEIEIANRHVFMRGPLREYTKYVNDDYKRIENKKCGLSVAWIFQSVEMEMSLIIENISLLDDVLFENNEFEIILCGPIVPNLVNHIENKFSRKTIKFLSYSLEDSEFSDFIGHKKNAIIRASIFSKLAILHSRIQINNNFVRHYLKSNDFFLSTPTVKYKKFNAELPYLDLVFLKKYNITSSDMKYLWGVKSNFLINMLSRIYKIYIDGGCLVFNFNKVGALYISEYHKWGYAEDVNLCWRADLMGFRMERSDVVVYSNTNKLNFYNKFYSKSAIIRVVYDAWRFIRFVIL